ncbi:MAG: hypothetical protein R2875_13270 [Desulfobacterales bacterium]
MNSSGSFKIFKQLGAKDKEYLMVNYERHGIINGKGSGGYSGWWGIFCSG